MPLLRPLAVAILLIGAAARGVAAQHDLVTLPIGDPAYRQLEGLLRQGCRPADISPHRPYAVAWIRQAIQAMGNDDACATRIVDELRGRFAPPVTDTAPRLHFGAAAELRASALRNGEFLPLWRDARPAGQGTPTAVGILRARTTWAATPSLVAVTEVYGQTDTRNDSRTRGQALREGSGVLDFSEAYVNGRIGPVMLSFGRGWEAWLGRGEESLILSAHGPPLDRLSAVARWSRWEARALLGSLDRVTLDPATDGPSVDVAETVHRMIAGHVLSFAPASWVDLTLGETVLIGRRSATPDLAFANPLMLYLVTQNDQDRVSEGNQYNVIVFGASRFSLGASTLDVELHIDDVQIDAVDRERIPDQLAWRIAGTTRMPLPMPASVGVEYRRIDSYTYSRGNYNAVYQRYDVPIGSELGLDADLIEIDVDAWLSGSLLVATSVGRWRRGAQRLDARPSVAAEGHADEPYPSVTIDRPAVQEAWLLGLSVERLGSTFPLGIRVEVANLDNVNHRPDSPATYARVSFVGTYRFRYP